MKKQYIKPATDIMNIETEQIMAASPTGISILEDSGEGALNNTSATPGGSALSKGHGFGLWDEDED